jgi:disease resistance protein RPM1
MRGPSVFEVAESYFDKFINPSISSQLKLASLGKAKTFRVHDVMYRCQIY